MAASGRVEQTQDRRAMSGQRASAVVTSKACMSMACPVRTQPWEHSVFPRISLLRVANMYSYGVRVEVRIRGGIIHWRRNESGPLSSENTLPGSHPLSSTSSRLANSNPAWPGLAPYDRSNLADPCAGSRYGARLGAGTWSYRGHVSTVLGRNGPRSRGGKFFCFPGPPWIPGW